MNNEQSWCEDTYEDFPKDGLKPTLKIIKPSKPSKPAEDEKERQDKQ